jgi:hypothetical protein
MPRKKQSKRGRNHSSRIRRRANRSRRQSNTRKMKLFGKPDQKKRSNKTQATKQSNSRIGKNTYKESCNKDIRKPFIFGPDFYPYVVYKNVGDGNYWMVSIRHFLPTPKMNDGDKLPDVTKAQYKKSINILKKKYKEDNSGKSDMLGIPATTIPCDHVNKEGRYINLS